MDLDLILALIPLTILLIAFLYEYIWKPFITEILDLIFSGRRIDKMLRYSDKLDVKAFEIQHQENKDLQTTLPSSYLNQFDVRRYFKKHPHLAKLKETLVWFKGGKFNRNLSSMFEIK